jgi:hypothetical protein
MSSESLALSEVERVETSLTSLKIRDSSTEPVLSKVEGLGMTENRTLAAKTCETTNRENHLRDNRSPSAADSFPGGAAQEWRLCRSCRNVPAGNG